MYVTSAATRLFEEVSSFVCFFILVLLPTLYATWPLFAVAKPKKAEIKAAQEQYIETKLQEHLSNLEACVNQKFAEVDNKMHHQYNTKHSRIEALYERLEAFEAMCKKELQAYHLILDNNSLLLELAIQSRKTRMDSNEKIHPLDHSRLDQTHQMRSLSTAVQGIADVTNTFSDLLPRVLALEISQSTLQETAPKFSEYEKQIKDLYQKLETVKDSVQRSRGDQLTLKTLVKFNRTALETKMNEMEADIRGQLATHNHQITDTIKIVAEGSVFVKEEFGKVQELVHDASAYCANLKETSDFFDVQLQYLLTKLIHLEQWLLQAASSDNENVQPDQIILY